MSDAFSELHHSFLFDRSSSQKMSCVVYVIWSLRHLWLIGRSNRTVTNKGCNYLHLLLRSLAFWRRFWRERTMSAFLSPFSAWFQTCFRYSTYIADDRLRQTRCLQEYLLHALETLAALTVQLPQLSDHWIIAIKETSQWPTWTMSFRKTECPSIQRRAACALLLT